MPIEVAVEYLCAGGNRHPSSADWDSASGLVCFGTERNLAIWLLANSIAVEDHYPPTRGILSITHAHEDAVNAVKFAQGRQEGLPIIISGSADHTIRLWQFSNSVRDSLICLSTVEAHSGSINCLSVLRESNLVVSGATDNSVKIWRIAATGTSFTLELLQKIDFQPKQFPLALSLYRLSHDGALILAVGGTRSTIDIYVSSGNGSVPLFCWQTALAGHDGWVRSLEFSQVGQKTTNDLLLASASQDKYIRLWRVHRDEMALGVENYSSNEEALPTLTNKSHRLHSEGTTYFVTFEALLLGHEDWIYSTRWNNSSKQLQLLSASADNSLVIWESEVSSGMWICKDRLGEVSAQRGSTTATGTTGGFWIGLWSGDGQTIISLGRTGSWRKWVLDNTTCNWRQETGVSGHIKDARDIAWSPDGSYLLSTSSDQTTRIHTYDATSEAMYWREIARPQIHGYDLNCVDAIGPWQFISGAEEKLLRVFDAPSAFANCLCKFTGIKHPGDRKMPQAASVPVLGLSNKEATPGNNPSSQQVYEKDHEFHQQDTDELMFKAYTEILSEDVLSRHTLWPECEKLYGHGFEVSSLAVSHDATIVATACKASSSKHAVIRLYETRTWQALSEPLTAHSLTVTSMAFSYDDQMLLSGGRDRQWTVFHRNNTYEKTFSLFESNPKGHARMILGVTWAPGTLCPTFGTAGRDKCLKLWKREKATFVLQRSITAVSAFTSIDFYERPFQGALLLACGLESGGIIIHKIDESSLNVLDSFDFGRSISPSLSVTRVRWQPLREVESIPSSNPRASKRLGVSSQDSSVRIVKISVV